MRLSCPACGATGAIEFFLMDAAAREAVLAAFSLPAPLARQVVAYLGLFRPHKRALTWDRVEKLLGELMEPIQAAQVTRNGITRPAPLDYWKEALDQVLNNRARLTLPLKSHGYLFEIVANMADKAGAQSERRDEESKRNPYLRDQRRGTARAGEVIAQTDAGKAAGRKALREAAGLPGDRTDD